MAYVTAQTGFAGFAGDCTVLYDQQLTASVALPLPAAPGPAIERPVLKGAKNPDNVGGPCKDGAGDPAIGAIDATTYGVVATKSLVLGGPAERGAPQSHPRAGGENQEEKREAPPLRVTKAGCPAAVVSWNVRRRCVID